MKLAAVILNYNNADECIEAVKRIENYSVIDAVIVVDNASSDNSRERLERFFDSLTAGSRKTGAPRMTTSENLCWYAPTKTEAMAPETTWVLSMPMKCLEQSM